MVLSSINLLLNTLTNFFNWVDSFVLFGNVSYLDLVIFVFILWLLVSNFIPRG